MDVDSASSETSTSYPKHPDKVIVDDSSVSDSASVFGSSTHASGSTGTASKFRTHEEQEELARKESRQVLISKVVMLSILFFCTLGAGLATFFFMREAEHEEFSSDELRDVLEGKEAIIHGMIDSFEDSITSIILTEREGHGDVFPNITIPHFEKKADDVKDVSGAILLAYAPLVQAEDRAGWEAYSVEHQGWIHEAFSLRGDGHLTAEMIHEQIFTRVDGKEIPAPDHASYCPLWQLSYAPVKEKVVNFDLLSNDIFNRVFEYAREAKALTFSEVFDTSSLFGNESLSHGRAFAPYKPESLLVQPVVDSFDSETSNAIGAVVAVIVWEDLLANALHGGHGVLAVLRDTCGGVFSYIVKGTEALYLGVGDKHDAAYDSKEVVFEFNALDGDETEVNSHCHYTAHFFPTRELEATYRTRRPAIFTLVVVSIFVFTALFFLLYDFLVRQRQEKVQTAAMKSNAIVSSLYPKGIRDRLFQQDSGGIDASNRQSSPSELNTTSKFRLKSYLNDTQKTHIDKPSDVEALGMEMYDSKPIADLFPNATVMFADLVGFTAWSSVREPSQVFTLLETLYRAFDKLATKRRVFKVETVGDCYVAVTGLPDPRKDHAVAMSRFAKDCLTKTVELTRKLEALLGPDTGDLGMRVGLHSGPVTAGVLRGDKSRFQLFGDTVNTAARMESTGARNRIQISSDTANYLRESGKEHWFVQRENTVIAKGKGEMQTFWLYHKASGLLAAKELKATLMAGGVSPDGTIHEMTDAQAEENQALSASAAILQLPETSS